MNSSVSKYLGSTLAANIIFFSIGLITTVIFYLIFEPIETIRGLVNIPPYLLLSGLFSAVLILGMTYLIPQMGARKLFILIIAGQILMAMIVSHYAIFGTPRDPLTIPEDYWRVHAYFRSSCFNDRPINHIMGVHYMIFGTDIFFAAKIKIAVRCAGKNTHQRR